VNNSLALVMEVIRVPTEPEWHAFHEL